MLLYVDEVCQEIESILAYAGIVREKFEAERPASELLLDAQALDARVENLATMLPDRIMAGGALRHTRWMLHWLGRGDVDSCRGDIVDIVEHDLPGTLKKVREWANGLAYVDADLRQDIAPLIRTRQFDSAIRKAFVVLKARLCARFGLDAKLDGVDLVNTLFGRNAPHFPDLDPALRQAYRDLFAGVFGVLRNRFAHGDDEADLVDLDAVITSVNLCLRLAGDFRQTPSDRRKEWES
jgi:hypothetical protein